jgi:tRNA-intron endonuclease
MADPKGESPQVKLSGCAGVVLADRVLVPDAASHVWWERERVGTPHGAGIVLSFTEAESLRQRGVLQVPDLRARARERQVRFEPVLPVYQDLRSRGVVAKSGFRFGTNLRGYKSDPDGEHAQWLITAFRSSEGVQWSDLSRGVRLAHGVRKEFLVALADAPIQYVRLSWFRP